MSEVALFIHSTATGPFMWAPMVGDCPEGVTPIAPTNRGYAMTDVLPRGTHISIQDEVAHIKSHIPEGTTGVHLIAHSYGGCVALALAADGTVPVRSMCLYEPVLFASLKAELDALPADVAAQVKQLYEDPDFLLNQDTGGDDNWIERFIDYWNQPGMWAAMPDKAKTLTRMVGWKMFQEVRMVSEEALPFDQYQTAVPLTLIQGEHTTLPAKAMVRRLAEQNPHAQVHTLDGQGHMALVTAPQSVRPLLADHWKRYR
jgi:pimeloyl-ACP methyl ester carboxylesterase